MVDIEPFISLLSDPISFAQPKDIGERKGCPLPRPAASLRCFKKLGAAELALTSHTNHGLPRNSDSPRSKPPNFLNHHRRGSRGFKVKTY